MPDRPDHPNDVGVGAGAAPDAAPVEEPVEELERRARLLARGLQFLQLLSRTFVSLSLTEREAILDTLLSLLMTQLEAQQGVAFLVDAEHGSLEPAGIQGFATQEVWLEAARQPLFLRLLSERFAQWVDPGAIAREWPGAPAELANGFAVVVIDLREEPVALVLLANKLSAEPLYPEELDFLHSAAAVASLVFAHAEVQRVQQTLLGEMEDRAAEARREAREKAEALREIGESRGVIEGQRLAIRELSTPILRVWDGVLVLPLLGLLDTGRASELMDRLLAAIVRDNARFAILDITGVEIVDTRTADYLIHVVRAAELIGAQCLLSGVRPAVAQTLVELGVDLSNLKVVMDLQAGLRECLRRQTRRGPG